MRKAGQATPEKTIEAREGVRSESRDRDCYSIAGRSELKFSVTLISVLNNFLSGNNRHSSSQIHAIKLQFGPSLRAVPLYLACAGEALWGQLKEVERRSWSGNLSLSRP
jgi:hypothetical protein